MMSTIQFDSFAPQIGFYVFGLYFFFPGLVFLSHKTPPAVALRPGATPERSKPIRFALNYKERILFIRREVGSVGLKSDGGVF